MAPVLIALIPLSLFARYQVEENRERTLEQAMSSIATASSALVSSERTGGRRRGLDHRFPE